MQLVIKILLFLFMSIFDPHALYYHHERKTHRGQVYQKKPTDYQATLSRTEIPRSINVLQTYGYRVSGPGNYIVDTFQYTIPFLVRFNRDVVARASTLFNFKDLLTNGLYDEINEVITPFARSYDSQFTLTLNLTSLYMHSLAPSANYVLTIPDVVEFSFNNGSMQNYYGNLLTSYNDYIWIGTQCTDPNWRIQPMQQSEPPDDLPSGTIFSHQIQDNDLFSQIINEQIDPEIDYRFMAIYDGTDSTTTTTTFTFEGYLVVSFLKKII